VLCPPSRQILATPLLQNSVQPAGDAACVSTGGEAYSSASELVEALLAYNLAVGDVDTDRTGHDHSQRLQRQQLLLLQPPAETTTSATSSWSERQRRHHDVGCDVTDDASTLAAAAADVTTGKRRQ